MASEKIRSAVSPPTGGGADVRASRPLGLRSSSLAHLLERCSSPALWIAPEGGVTHANGAARALFAELPERASLAGTDAGAERRILANARSLLGLGWRELLPLAREGGSDLLLKLPSDATVAGRGRSTRVTLEPILDDGDRVIGLLALLEPQSGRSRALRGGLRRAAGEPRGDGAFAAIFGLDARLERAITLARRFADTSLPILLLAETGTGKDLMARAIHRASPRAAGPYVAINCGGLSPHLLESELFGYAPGAFTGARREGQEGKLGAADGGTLFLDEVAEMPRALQAILLRFLEDGTFYRVGDNHPRHADVRLVCATCRNLPRRVEEGSFRQDLYYRIKGACLTLPALRDRSDIEELSRFLLTLVCDSRSADKLPTVSREAMDWILHHRWLGNVRELKNALRYAVALADDEIRLEHLPVEDPLSGSLLEAATLSPSRRPGREPETGESISLEAAEKAALDQALASADGNLSAAARTLGIARSTLYRLLDRHGVDRRRL